MSALDPDIARQPPKPPYAKPTPEREPDEDNYRAKNDQNFPDLRHRLLQSYSQERTTTELPLDGQLLTR